MGDEGCAFGIAAMLALEGGVERESIRDGFTVYCGRKVADADVAVAVEEEVRRNDDASAARAATADGGAFRSTGPG